MRLTVSILFFLSAPTVALGAEFAVHHFDRQRLTDTYYSEGINVGDVNGDGNVDVVHGPYWFEGPQFKVKHEIYPAKAQPRQRYADNFFCWVHDFNADQRNDVLVVGFPGTPAFVYENPGGDGLDKHWPKHQVIDQVSNESPQFVDVVGDPRPELVCTRDGHYGYWSFESGKGCDKWTFTGISEKVAPKPFGHGLGVGDVNGDKRQDVLASNGWFEHPAEPAKLWKFHGHPFAGAGADIFAYDVDGDGDNDVITSLSAHNFGLAWYEHVRDGDAIRFKAHLIMGDKPETNAYGVVFSELHSVNLADIDGDGLKDIVTGKTYWSHHTQSPMWDAGAVVYWFKLVRGDDGVEWIPMQADGDAGIGRQLIVADVNNDTQLDIVVGGMKGAHVLTHHAEAATKEQYLKSLPQKPKPFEAGLSPKDAAANMTVPPGFHVQLAAGEPLVHQPIAMAYDHRGRLWVAEAHTYPVRAPEGEGKDKIIILEDTDLDGTLDKRTVFIEGLNLVSGLEVGFGGVWVGAAPYLMFIPDKDGDDVPDAPQPNARAQPSLQFPKDVPPGAKVLLDGFGWHDTHETLNTFIWGPDGWLYGCHGVFTHSKVSKPGLSDAERITLNAGVWRYHPIYHEFEVFARGTSNPWGVDFNAEGQAFITACVIPHLWHVIPGARYQRQGGQHLNPHTYDDIKTIADHAHYVGNIRDHAWWGHEPTVPTSTSQAGGGHAHCGAMIYLGDNWPKEYRNKIYFNNIHGNRVNCDVLEREGSGYVGHHGKDLMLANDRWFRGINLRYGPDGTVHLIDWYDKNACHRRTPEIWDRTNGRIYRIVYGDRKPERVDLSKLTDKELVELHTHENQWYVRMARRLLMERNTDYVHSGNGEPPELVGLRRHIDVLACDARVLHRFGSDSETVSLALRALSTLRALRTGVDPSLLLNRSPSIRAWAVRAICEGNEVDHASMNKLLAVAEHDINQRVRLELASALQRLPLVQRWMLAQHLLAHEQDNGDHNLPLMVWYGIEPLVPTDPARAMALAKESKIPLVTRYIVRRAAADEASLEGLVAELNPSAKPEWQQLILDEMLLSFEGRVDIPMPKTWKAAYEHLAKSKNAGVLDKAEQIAVLFGDARVFPRLRSVLTDEAAPIKSRQRALDVIVRGRDRDAANALLAVVMTKGLSGPSIRALANYNDAKIATTLLESYAKLSPASKRDAIATLTARAASANSLLDAIESEQVKRTDLHAYNVRQILALNDAKLTARLKETWGEIRESSAEKKEQIAALKQLLTKERLTAGDRSNGRRLFAKTCASCHKLFGTGGDVGPEITGSNRANLDYILENVVDPSAVMGRDYRMTMLQLDDGRVVSGLLQKETDSALTIRTLNDTQVLAKSDIEQRTISKLSMMPERLLDSLSKDAVVDLVAYLGSPTQVIIRGPRSPIDPKTGRVPDAIEGESIKILAKTAGNARSQPMSSFCADRWSGKGQLWWTGAKPGDELTLELNVKAAGSYQISFVLTRARDYGVVQLSLDDKPLGEAIDLFNSPEVVTTGVIESEVRQLTKGQHQLKVRIISANEKAAKAFMFGLDYIRLERVES